MASYADNNAYIKFGTTEVQAYFKDVQLQPSNTSIDTTAGANTDWVERAPGLNSVTLSVTLQYDAADVQNYIQRIAPGQIITVEYGPEGATSGKPRHVQDFNITGASHTVSVTKADVVFQITGESAGAPSVNMFAGGVYA